MHLRVMTGLAFGAALVLSGSAFAQQWPSRAITVVSPYPPGGTNDIVGRAFTDRMGAKVGQALIMANKPGAGGIVGSISVQKSAPDGYTLLTANNAALILQPVINAEAKYDLTTNFTPIVRYAVSYQFVGVSSKVPANNMKEFVDLLLKNPGKLNYGSSGTGSFGHISGELLRLLTGATMQHIPFPGSARAVQDLAAGEIQAMIDPLVLSQRASGNVKVLATSAPKRLAAYPDIPTMIEAGFPEFDPVGWFGLFGPADLPKDIQKKLAEAAASFANDPEVIKTIETAGLTPGVMIGDEFDAFLKKDKVKYEEIKTKSNIKIEN